jgi:hypothetical protein
MIQIKVVTFLEELRVVLISLRLKFKPPPSLDIPFSLLTRVFSLFGYVLAVG